ncbi:MAG: hypothetical protein WDA18_08795 [Candidatus Ratteibacteria bacterium]
MDSFAGLISSAEPSPASSFPSLISSAEPSPASSFPSLISSADLRFLRRWHRATTSDEDLTGSLYSAKGPYVIFRFKIDETLFRK